MNVELQSPARLSCEPDEEELASYRALSTLAVVSLVLGVLSMVAFLDWTLSIVPLAGIVAGSAALWRIGRQPDELTGSRLAAVGVVLSVLFLLFGWTRLAYVYATEVPPGYQRIHYGQLQLEPGADGRGRQIPASALELDGRRVFVKGYVFPGRQQQGISQFVLVRDNGDCCFGGPAPPPGDMIHVALDEPLRLDYSTRLHRVAGTFRVAVSRSADVDDSVILYQLQADYIQ